MRRISHLGLIAAACLACAATASAHDSNGSYWTERYGALRLERSYSDIVDADCLGLGTMAVDPGR